MISNPLILGVISNPNILKVLNPWWICQIQILYLFKISQTSYLNFNHQNLNSNAQIMSTKHTIKSFGVGGTFFFFFQVETPIFVCEAAILPLEIWVVFYVKLSNSFIGMK